MQCRSLFPVSDPVPRCLPKEKWGFQFSLTFLSWEGRSNSGMQGLVIALSMHGFPIHVTFLFPLHYPSSQILRGQILTLSIFSLSWRWPEIYYRKRGNLTCWKLSSPCCFHLKLFSVLGISHPPKALLPSHLARTFSAFQEKSQKPGCELGKTGELGPDHVQIKVLGKARTATSAKH